MASNARKPGSTTIDLGYTKDFKNGIHRFSAFSMIEIVWRKSRHVSLCFLGGVKYLKGYPHSHGADR